MRNTLISLVLLASTIGALSAYAAVPPLSDDELRSQAYYVLSGKILEITKTKDAVSNRCLVITNYDAQLQTEDDGTLYIHYKRNKAKPECHGFVGPVGQSYLPASGDQVKVYLDDHYRALEPNGIQRITSQLAY